MIVANPTYSDYIVYADESGDHSLKFIDEKYPIFVLSFCVFRKDYYSDFVTSSLRKLKFATFGHDMVILHEQDIRKRTGDFSALGKEERESFLEALNSLIAQTEFIFIPTVIDKHKLKIQNTNEVQVYHLAMELSLSKLYRFFQGVGQHDRLTYIICEARGRVEDIALITEFQHVCTKNSFPFKLILADKRCNSEGLQFADLIARPVGLSFLKPNQSNRALKILEKKLHKDKDDMSKGYEIHVYPLKSEKPQGSP